MASGKQGALRFRFNAFGHYLETQPVRHGDDGANHGQIGIAPGFIGHVADEGAIDLEGGDGKSLQVSQGGIACAEIIQRNGNPGVAQLLQLAQRPGFCMQQDRLGHLDLQAFRR